MIAVRFVYHTGLVNQRFRAARLVGDWDSRIRAMTPTRGEDGLCFEGTVEFPDHLVGRTLSWSVSVESAPGRWVNGVPAETGPYDQPHCRREFVLTPGENREEHYYLSRARTNGANIRQREGSEPGLSFAVWVPNARVVEVIFAGPSGYIADDGTGIDPAFPPIHLQRTRDGMWEANPTTEPRLAHLARFLHRPYLFRITREQGSVALRTDLYSRCQMGSGEFNPRGKPFTGRPEQLDGSVSCSIVEDPDSVLDTKPGATAPTPVSARDFWRTEFDWQKPIPRRLEDLVIYELHVASLGSDPGKPGTLGDAILFLDHLVELGINAVELMPLAEFGGAARWGYATSHYFACEHSAGGRDRLKHFVRACHRRGIAVILDVVYNHYIHDAERAQWQYDSERHEHNIWYWYEGRPEDYPTPEGGYLDNGSTGFTPAFDREQVRALLISSAVAFVEEFHIDGFRVDLVNAIHRDNVRHADGLLVGRANQAGIRFLREWARTLRLIRPDILLIAEDHSDWEAITRPLAEGGMGFDATWYAPFCHHLVGNPTRSRDFAQLVLTAGRGEDSPLALDYFAGALVASAERKIIYPSSHDEVGNSEGSRRTLLAAIAVTDPEELKKGDRRTWAEARARLAIGLTLLAPGTPMLFMGEEVGAVQPFRHNDFLNYREDLRALARGSGQGLFAFTRAVIALRRSSEALRSRHIEIVHTNNIGRVLAFLRRSREEELLVVATFHNRGYPMGYALPGGRIPPGRWQTIFSPPLPNEQGSRRMPWSTARGGGAEDLLVTLAGNGLVVLRLER